MMYANFLLVFLLSISSWSQGVSCDQIFQRLLMDQALSTGHQEHEVWLDFETVLRVHTIPQSHRPQFSLNAELLVPQQSLLQALLDVTDPNKHPSSQASYGLEILPRDTHRWFGQMGILQAITSVYPQSTTIHISAIEVLPKPTLQKLIVQIRFSLVDHSKKNQGIDSLYLNFMQALDQPVKNFSPIFFWKKQPRLSLDHFVINTSYQFFSSFQKAPRRSSGSQKTGVRILQSFDILTDIGLFPLHLFSKD